MTESEYRAELEALEAALTEREARIAVLEAAAEALLRAAEATTDCRSETGIAVGLIDSIISNLRVLRRHYAQELEGEEMKEALSDLAQDEDLAWLLEHLPDPPT